MLSACKQYMGVDYPDDDKLIASLILAGYSYLEGALYRGYDRNDPRAKLLLEMLVADWYEQRGTTLDTSKVSNAVHRTVDTMCQQLRMEHNRQLRLGGVDT